MAVRNGRTLWLVELAIFSALIIVMTFVPNTGYISVGPIEMTTLHLVVIIGAVFTGWKGGAILGGVWGVTCLIRAFTNPLWVMFTNPLISVLPRILVGIVAGALFLLLSKRISKPVAAIAAAIAATLTNTVLVLSSIYIFGGMIESYATFFELFQTIITTIVGLNGVIELIAAVVFVPTIHAALATATRKQTA